MTKNGRLIFFVVFLIIGAALVNSELECRIIDTATETCDGATIIRMSSLSGGHVEFPSESNYNYSLCCQDPFFQIGNSCQDGITVLKLNKQTNSHAQIPSISTYPFDVCISSDDVDITCQYKSECDAGYACLAQITSNENGVIGQCNSSIKTKICCMAKPPSKSLLVAIELLEMAKNEQDFVLFCDEHEAVLNKLNYDVQGTPVKQLIGVSPNNFCVLLFGENVFVGTYLNKPLRTNDPFLQALGTSTCNFKGRDSSLSTCWYNNNTDVIIYSNQDFSVGESNLLTIFTSFIKQPFKTIVGIIKNAITPPVDSSFETGLREFDKLYISKKKTDGVLKEIRGTIDLDNSGTINLVVEYANFDTDICKSVRNFNDKIQKVKAETGNLADSTGVECYQEGVQHYVLGQGSQFTLLNPETIWSDLTSKLR